MALYGNARKDLTNVLRRPPRTLTLELGNSQAPGEGPTGARAATQTLLTRWFPGYKPSLHACAESRAQSLPSPVLSPGPCASPQVHPEAVQQVSSGSLGPSSDPQEPRQPAARGPLPALESFRHPGLSMCCTWTPGRHLNPPCLHRGLPTRDQGHCCTCTAPAAGPQSLGFAMATFAFLPTPVFLGAACHWSVPNARQRGGSTGSGRTSWPGPCHAEHAHSCHRLWPAFPQGVPPAPQSGRAHRHTILHLPAAATSPLTPHPVSAGLDPSARPPPAGAALPAAARS